jgi:hypothetical protein
MGSLILFAALCSSNCIGIAIWERDLDRAQRKNSAATRWSGIQIWFRRYTLVLGFIALMTPLMRTTAAQLYCCIGASFFLLATLDWSNERILRDERTALADLMLLTPLLLLLSGFA